MIRVTVWYEYVQEAGEFNEEFLPKDMSVEEKARLKKRVADVAAKIKEVYPQLPAPFVELHRLFLLSQPTHRRQPYRIEFYRPFCKSGCFQ